MVTLDYEKLKLPEYSSLFRATGFFDRIFNGKIEDINCWLAGGCFRAFFQPSEKIDDIDIFTVDRKEAARLIYRLRKEFDFQPYFINKNAIKGIIKSGGKQFKVDVVKRFYENQEKSIEDFDYSVSKFSYSLKSKAVVYSENFFADLIMKRLVIPDTGYGNPLGSLKRLTKYQKKGYSACNGTLLTIAKRISSVDFNNPEENDIEFYPDGTFKILLFD